MHTRVQNERRINDTNEKEKNNNILVRKTGFNEQQSSEKKNSSQTKHNRCHVMLTFVSTYGMKVGEVNSAVCVHLSSGMEDYLDQQKYGNDHRSREDITLVH